MFMKFDSTKHCEPFGKKFTKICCNRHNLSEKHLFLLAQNQFPLKYVKVFVILLNVESTHVLRNKKKIKTEQQIEIKKTI